MKRTSRLGLVIGVTAALMLGACGTTNTPPYAIDTRASNPAQPYSGNGVVHSIELVQQDRETGIGASGIGLGTVAGAVIGGVVGNQVGSGSGNTVATIVGAAGGAYVGHEIENRQRQEVEDVYRITIRMQDGSYQTLIQDTDASLRVGDRVRIGNGVVYRY